MDSQGENFPIISVSKKRQKTMDITQLIGDLGFPIVVSLILIYKLDYKLDEILKEIRELKNQN
ncbi:YvrJ family protein [Anaerococcus cruorum]